MEIWFILAGLSLLTVVALVWGARRLGSGLGTDSASAQLAIYKDQLSEIEADLVRGVLAPQEADAHRAEVARRMLAVNAGAAAPVAHGRNWLVLLPVLLVPLVAFALYARSGAPSLPDLPQAERMANAEKTGDLEAMIYKVEQHLQNKPDDVAGWEVILPSYKAMARYGDAARALQQIIKLKGGSAEAYADLAEIMMFSGNGLMPADGMAAAREALKLDPKNSKARYYEALGLSQDNQQAAALAAFETLLADAPADAPWRAAVENQIAELKKPKTTAPGPTEQQVQDAAGMSAGDQQAMIRSMVDGLAAKLEADPKNIDGWLRLIRARVVLKETDAAQAALDKARSTFEQDQDAVSQLAALAQELGLK
jgi:cytochrome c-type biogenesis protein CcmH